MSFRATFADLKLSRTPAMMQFCPDDVRLKAFCNEAIQRLLERGRWWGTVVKARFCITSGCLTWPRQVAAIEAVHLDGISIPVRNQWYEFLEYQDPRFNCCECSSNNSDGTIALQDRGTAPTVIDMVANRKVRAYITDTSDATKILTIQGYDTNNLWVRTQVGTKWYDGERLTLAYPHVTSSTTWNTITGIQKQETNLRVPIYEYNPANGGMRTLAIMEPDEKIANYRRSYIPGIDCLPLPTSGCEYHTVTAMVKLDYHPVSSDEDWLLIGNIPALKDMIMAIWAKEQGDASKSIFFEQEAIKSLNHELRTFTADKRSFSIAAHGSANFNLHTAGYV